MSVSRLLPLVLAFAVKRCCRECHYTCIFAHVSKFLRDKFQEVDAMGLECSCSMIAVSLPHCTGLQGSCLQASPSASPSNSKLAFEGGIAFFQEVRDGKVVVGGREGLWAFYKPLDRPRSIMHVPKKASTLSHSLLQLAHRGGS